CPEAKAQQRQPPLHLQGLMPGGVRRNVTERWGTLDFLVTNTTDTDRQARVLLFFEGQADRQYGRDVWVPARSSLVRCVRAGPAPRERPDRGRAVQSLLYDRTGGKETLILPDTEERVRSRLVPYRQREPSTSILLDLAPTTLPGEGQLPRDPPSEEIPQV